MYPSGRKDTVTKCYVILEDGIPKERVSESIIRTCTCVQLVKYRHCGVSMMSA